jgi:hypothetical protein
MRYRLNLVSQFLDFDTEQVSLQEVVVYTYIREVSGPDFGRFTG